MAVGNREHVESKGPLQPIDNIVEEVFVELGKLRETLLRLRKLEDVPN